MANINGNLSGKGALVDTNNDGVVDGFAHTIKNSGNFSTFSVTNGVLSLAPSSSGASIGGDDTHVQFNDAGSLNGESTFTYNKTSNTLTIANVVISGDLTVSGTTTTVNTATLDIADNIITLNSDLGAGVAPSQNAGILINRGSADDVELVWDETNDRWDFDGYTLASVGKVQASGSGAVYTFGTDTATGIEHTGTNQLGLLVNNTRVLMVSVNGVHIAPAGATGAGSNQALLVDNIAIDTNTISSSDTNGNIVLAPNGTGDVQVDADTLRVGDSGSDATITSNGAGDLTISTNGGTDSGYVKVEDGANNDILIIPNGTGKVGIGQLTPTEILHVDGNAIITGNLTVQGATTTVSTTNTFVSDSVMTLNSGETANGVSGNVAGFEVDRGENTGVDNPLARFVFDDSDDKFKVQMETGSGTGSYNAAGLVASTIEGTTGTFSGDVAVDTDTLFVDVSTERVGINVASPTEALDITGSIKASANIEIGGNGDISGRLNANLTTKVQNETGSTISKGSPVYISATHASGRPQVSLTDADASTNKYPAIGLVYADISTGSQGYALTFGVVEDVPASLFVGTDPSVGDTLYISATEGKITVDRPSSSTVKVQNIGRIVKTNVSVSGNSGTAHILVQGPGRTNDIPNDIGDEDIIAAASASNYTPTASTVEGHLAGIDTALGSVDTDTVRTVTAGGNTLDPSETLAFTAGSNVTITESAGAVTIASTDTNTFRTVTAGGNTLGASEPLAFAAGSNITIAESGGVVTIAASGGSSYTDAQAIAAVEGEATLDLTGQVTMAQDLKVSGVQYQQFMDLTGDLATGYHSIAVLPGRSGGLGNGTGDSDQRAVGTFLIRNTDSSRHQTIMLTASHLFGAGNANGISVEHASYFSTIGISGFRIKENSTYDGAVLQINIADATNDIEVYLKNNFQEAGWQLIQAVDDATDPSTGSLGLGYDSVYSDFTASATTSITDIAGLGQQIFGPLVLKSDLNVEDDMTVGTNALVVDSLNKKVGVGTTSPTNALHVTTNEYLGDAAYAARFQAYEGNVGVTRYGGIHLSNDNTAPIDGEAWETNRWQIGPRDGNQLDISYGTPSNTNIAASETDLRITTAGDVGIGLGATDPSTKLHVKGNVLIEDPTSDGSSDHLLEVKSGSSATPDNARILVSADTDAKLPMIHIRDVEANSGTFSTHYSAYLALDRASAIVTGSAQNDLLIANGNLNKDIHLCTNNASDGSQAQARLTIVGSDGDVGIGTTSPAQKLHVNGTIRQTSVTSAVLVANTNGDLVAASNLADQTYLAPGSAQTDVFTPALSGPNWAFPPPGTIQEAIDRLAAYVVTIPGAPPQIP